jgi:hypothetical protein
LVCSCCGSVICERAMNREKARIAAAMVGE